MSGVALTKVAMSPNSDYVAIAVEHPKVRVFNVASGTATIAFSTPDPLQNNLTALSFGTDAAENHLVAVGDSAGFVTVWDIQTNAEVFSGQVSTEMLGVAALCIRQKTLFVVMDNSVLTVVSLGSNSATSRVQLNDVPVVKMPASVAVHFNKRAKTWSVLVGGTVAVLYEVNVATHMNGAKMDKSVKLAGHRESPTTAWISANGQFLGTASASDGSLKVWRAADGQCVLSLACNTRVAQVAFAERKSGSARQLTVTATGHSGSAYVWFFPDIDGMSPKPSVLKPPTTTFHHLGVRIIGFGVVPNGEGVVLVRGLYGTPVFHGFTGDYKAKPTWNIPAPKPQTVKGMTTKEVQKLRMTPLSAVDAFVEGPAVKRADGMQKLPKPSGEGGAGMSVALYQALHAGDAALAVELLDAVSRSTLDLKASIQALEAPYALQLLQMLAKRAAFLPTSSPLHVWIRLILVLRGVELAQQPGADLHVRPLLHHYKVVSELAPQVAHIHGRLACFQAIKPSRGTVQFGLTFKENKKDQWTMNRHDHRTPARRAAAAAEVDEGEAVASRRRRRRKAKKAKAIGDDKLLDALDLGPNEPIPDDVVNGSASDATTESAVSDGSESESGSSSSAAGAYDELLRASDDETEEGEEEDSDAFEYSDAFASSGEEGSEEDELVSGQEDEGPVVLDDY